MNLDTNGVSISNEILKHGSYYVGYDAQYCGKPYIAKREHLNNEISKMLLKQESNLLIHLNHPCIVQQLAMLDNLKSSVLLMERMHMSLTEFLTSKHSYHDKISILYDAASGLQYIHEKGIIHCDLTADNILLNEKNTAKLADFGRAILCQQNTIFLPETLDHLPPEIFEPYSKARYSTKVDIFSFGCVIIHTVTHDRPIPDFDKYIETSEVGKYIKHSEVERRPFSLKNFKSNCNSAKLHIITLKCLEDHPGHRPTAATVCSTLHKQLAISLPVSFKFGMFNLIFSADYQCFTQCYH